MLSLGVVDSGRILDDVSSGYQLFTKTWDSVSLKGRASGDTSHRSNGGCIVESGA